MRENRNSINREGITNVSSNPGQSWYEQCTNSETRNKEEVSSPHLPKHAARRTSEFSRVPKLSRADAGGPRKGWEMSGDLTVAGCTGPGSREVSVGPRGPDPPPQSEHSHRARRRRTAPVLKLPEQPYCVQKVNPREKI